MVGRPERTPVGQRAALDLAGDGRDHRDFKKLGRRQRWQNRGQPCREHRLAGAGWPHHEQVVAASGCDFERGHGAFLMWWTVPAPSNEVP